MPELDTIRFLSIVLVVLHHQFFRSNGTLAWFADYGWVGVDIFFCLSGFLITSILMTERRSTGTIDLRRFWFRRALRLWPSWFFTLALSFTLVWLLSTNNPEVREGLLSRWWHYFLHFGNYSYIFYGKIHTLYSHFWSLAVEEHFYLLWPLLVLVLRGRRSLLAGVALLVLTSWLLRLWHLGRGEVGYVLSFSTHTRIDELLLGCALALGSDRLRQLRPGEEVALTLAMVGLFWFGLGVCKENPSSLFLPRALLRIPLLSQLGILSYGVYLIHLHVSTVVFALDKKLGLGLGEVSLALLNLALPFFPAYLMLVFIDGPLARFRHRPPKLALAGAGTAG
jgi:peptidoglycan/LPS O-acetylase OafA/YrhL